jgi:hypothetical protein
MLKILYLLAIATLYCLSRIFTETDPTEQLAIAPMLAIGLGASALQTGMGLWQSNKASKMKADDSAERAAMAKMVANQKQIIGRTKMREAMGGEMPGMSRTEAKLGASTAHAVEAYKEMGNQAGYQDFLNKALMSEQQKIADLGSESAQYKLDRSLDVDTAMGEMGNIHGMQFRRGAQQTDQQKADIAAAKATAAGNIGGGLTSAASMGMLMAGGGMGK